jgi:PadR family transcriptional regulator
MYSAGMRIHKDLMGASAAPLILSILAAGESYGYALIQRVHELSAGQIEWTDGMLYPVLHRLEAQGYVQSRWRVSESGRRRKYYALKAAGRKALEAQRQQWLVVHLAFAKLWEI